MGTPDVRPMRLLRLTSAISLVFVAACGVDADPLRLPEGAAPLLMTLEGPVEEATRGIRSGRLVAARGELEAALAVDPDRVAALNDLAVTYSLDGRFDAARALLEEILARGGPRDQLSALVNLAELYALEGYLAAAEAHLRVASSIDPSRSEPAYALALLADARGDAAGAWSALQAAMAADPSGADRAGLVFLAPEERTHLEALVAEASGDAATAEARWRELARGRFRVLTLAAQRHLLGE